MASFTRLLLLLIFALALSNANAFTPAFKHFMERAERMLDSPAFSPNTVASNANASKTISPRCNATLMALFDNPVLLEYYADAVGKPPAGILTGALAWLGSYDECLAIPDAHYCLTNLWTGKAVLKWGICVPKECTEDDVALGLVDLIIALKIKLYPIPDKLDGVTKTVHCAKPSEYTASVIATLFVFGFILSLCLIGTIIEMVLNYNTPSSALRPANSKDNMSVSNGSLPDAHNDRMIPDDEKFFSSGHPSRGGSSMPVLLVEKKKNNIIVEVFLCFSLIRNTSRILDTNVPPGAITSINGMRVLSMLWVILGHTFFFMILVSGVTANVSLATKVVQRFTFQAILNASVSVDSFFFLSGLLVAYLSFRHMEKNHGKLNLFQFYFHRFWRLTPAYMLVILFYDKLTGFLGEGPMWYSQQVNPLCDKYWWTNLLYINNFYPTKLADECMGWSWYLANDMQFYVISPVILYLTYRFGLKGLLSTTFPLLITSFSVTGYLVDHYSFDVNGQTTDPEKPDSQSIVYVKPYCRIAPYLVGLALGYALHWTERSGGQRVAQYFRHFAPKRITQCLLACGWGIAIICTLAPLYGTYSTFKENPKPFTNIENIMYTTFFRFSWAVGLAWVVFACHIGKGGLVNKILSARFWIPLSRLTYMAYLVHLIVMSVAFSSTRTATFYSDVHISWNFLAAATTSYFCAFIVSVTMEIPMMQLEKIIFKTHRKKD